MSGPERRRFASNVSFRAEAFGAVPRIVLLVILVASALLVPQKSEARTETVYSHGAIALPRSGGHIRAAPVSLSEFDRELTMTPEGLLDRWNPLIAEASRRFGVSEVWIRAVMRMESGGRTMLDDNQPITSNAGAMGIMQVMPETYQDMREEYGLGTNPYSPRDNIFAGTAYLRWLYRKYGYPAMFAAYNDGPGKLEDHLERGTPFPTETRGYIDGVASILGYAPRHGRLSPAGFAKLTRPDGSPVLIDGSTVQAIRAPLPGEYDTTVQSVLTIGRLRQAVQENVKAAAAIIRKHGGTIFARRSETAAAYEN